MKSQVDAGAAGDMARTEEEALKIANELGFPDMVRPSFVLGGRAMEIVYRWALCRQGHQHICCLRAAAA